MREFLHKVEKLPKVNMFHKVFKFLKVNNCLYLVKGMRFWWVPQTRLMRRLEELLYPSLSHTMTSRLRDFVRINPPTFFLALMFKRIPKPYWMRCIRQCML